MIGVGELYPIGELLRIQYSGKELFVENDNSLVSFKNSGWWSNSLL